MRCEVPYGKGTVSFETDAPCTVKDVECPACPDPDEVMRQALDCPLGDAGDFGDFARSSGSLLFILCDATRPTPTARVLEHLHPHLKGHPGLRLIIATGTHREPTEAEYRTILGRFHDEFRPLTTSHDSRNPDANVRVGTTSRGTPVSFDRAVLEADGIVTLNSVEPHYFAGYTGGRKSFLPGIAGFDTIERNHSHACDPGARAMMLEGNPISEDMYEAATFLSGKRMFSVQTVMAPDGRLHSAFAGEQEPAFRAAIGSAERLFSVAIPHEHDIVVAVAPPPMDLDLYQSQKALENGRLALRKGGVIILVSECRDGIGDRGFYDMLAGFGEGESISNYMGTKYRLGNHKAARMLALCEHAGAVFAVTSLSEDVLGKARMKGFESLQEAVDRAISMLRMEGREPDIIVLPGASLTVPRVMS